MEDVSGRDLTWFWREWFYTTDVLDQAVDTVTQTSLGNSYQASIVLANRSRVVMPVSMRLTLANGETRDVHLPVQIWYGGNQYTYTTLLPAKLTGALLDPKHALPDQHRDNDSWNAPAAAQGRQPR